MAVLFETAPRLAALVEEWKDVPCWPWLLILAFVKNFAHIVGHRLVG